MRNTQRGQAAVELAVFGAIIIFLIGGIVRSAMSANFQQNQQLKSMRMALLKSYQTSQYDRGAGRNSATFMFIEDRITPDIGRYGATERSPLIAGGSGTLSNMLMYPLEESELDERKHIPGIDVFINGKYFYFTTARKVWRSLDPPPSYGRFYVSGSVPDPAGNSTHRYNYTHPSDPRQNISWNFMCQPVNDPVLGFGYAGCPLLYQIAVNPGDAGILTPEESFNLRRTNNYADNPPPHNGNPCPSLSPNQVCVNDMAWKWRAINGVQGAVVIDPAGGNLPMYDVDMDLQEEVMYAASYDGNGVMTGVSVFDFQEGDINSTHDNMSPGKRPGMQNDMAVYTEATPKTFLKVKEGKLYNPETGVFVRSTNNRDQVSIVQREFQLSNDTGRFCSGGSPTPGWENPVEVCGGCFSPAHIGLTCFDTSNRVLYIRSRLSDKRGHNWKTDAGWPYPQM